MTHLLEMEDKARRPHFAAARPTILCVDDDPEISRTIELRMRSYDVDVRRAFHGMQGIWEAVRKRPDLIIMDLAMPNGDGCYILSCLRDNMQTAGIPIMVLTGMRDQALMARVMHAGADHFLRKPVSFDELLHNISRFIDLQPRPNAGADN